MRISYPFFAIITTIMLSGCMSNTSIKSDNEKPNFIIFIADDLSWNDFGCTGNKDVQTPNIDRLAKEGVVFNKVYLTASSCSPSRVSILTSRYPHNTGAAELHTEPKIKLASFPEELKNSGYYTVASGKWHAGELLKEGFVTTHIERKLIGPGGEKQWVEAIRDRPKDKPFMFWAASIDSHRGWGENDFSGTHAPEELSVPSSLVNTYETRKDLANYYDEITRFDYYIGEVIKVLEEQNAMDNTMIIVMADNGRPFPRAKTLLIDDGIKTPFILYWKNKFDQTGIESESLISSIDIGATLLDLAGLKIPESFQGKSFAAVLDNPSMEFRNYAFAERNWHDLEAFGRMVRSRDYLYIINKRPNNMYAGGASDIARGASFQDLVSLWKNDDLYHPEHIDFFKSPRNQEELYHPESDPRQINDLSSLPEYQDKMDSLREILDVWSIETGDDDPGTITPDWYHRITGARLSDETNHLKGERGIMAGENNKADQINKNGPF